MQKFNVKVKFKTPYMQHRMDDQSLEGWEKNRGKIIERLELVDDDSKRAAFHSYNKDGQYYIPMEHFKAALINAGKMVRSKVGASRKSMADIVAGMFIVRPFQIFIPPFDEIDKRSAVNRNIKGRVIIIRPKWNTLTCNFQLHVDNNSITLETIKEIIQNAGDYIGVGSYRPTNKGEFGRFDFVSINPI